MTRSRRLVRRWSGPLAVVSGLFCFSTLLAQDNVLRGRIVDRDGRPMADTRVVLHAVGSAGGAAVDRTTSDATGRFVLEFPQGADSSAAADRVYFAAVRHENGLYIGPMFRPPVDAAPYEIVVGGKPAFTSGTGSGRAPAPGVMRPIDPPAAAGTGGGNAWWIIGIACLGAAALLWLGMRPRGRPSEQRRLLRDLAVLEEQHGLTGDGADSVDAYERDRTALLRRLRRTVRE